MDQILTLRHREPSFGLPPAAPVPVDLRLDLNLLRPRSTGASFTTLVSNQMRVELKGTGRMAQALARKCFS